MAKDLLKDYEAAEFLGMSVSTIRRWRTLNKGPSFVRLCNSIRYPKSSLEKYLEDMVVDTKQ